MILDTPLKWKPVAEVPRFQEPYLVKMVQLAAWARDNNITREEKLNRTIN